MLRRESQDIVGERSSRSAGSISSVRRRLKNFVSFRGIGPRTSVLVGLKDPGRFGELFRFGMECKAVVEPFLLEVCGLVSELSPITLSPE